MILSRRLCWRFCLYRMQPIERTTEGFDQCRIGVALDLASRIFHDDLNLHATRADGCWILQRPGIACIGYGIVRVQTDLIQFR